MTPLVYSVWLLSALGAGIFAASAGGSKSSIATTAVAFAVGSVLYPEPVLLGFLAALAGGISISWGKPRLVSAAASGVLAGGLGSLIRAQSIPLVPSLLAAGAIPAVAMYLSARFADFAPRRLRDEGLVLMVVLGIALAAAPGISAGWASANGLNVQSGNPARQAIPVWVLVTGASSLAMGGIYSMWRRS